MTTSAELPILAHERDSRPDEPRYRVLLTWGVYLDFGTFEEALAHYAKSPGASTPIGLANYDGSIDGSDGLTADERERAELQETEW